MSSWNDRDAEDDFDVDQLQDENIFEGSVEEEREETKRTIMSKIYGE